MIGKEPITFDKIQKADSNVCIEYSPNPNELKIQVRDVKSSTIIAELFITPTNLIRAMAGQVYVNCLMKTGNSEFIGKQLETGEVVREIKDGLYKEIIKSNPMDLVLVNGHLVSILSEIEDSLKDGWTTSLKVNPYPSDRHHKLIEAEKEGHTAMGFAIVRWVENTETEVPNDEKGLI